MNRKVLLLEPRYKAKYPPLGLMKISSFHKEKGDKVLFAKGRLQDDMDIKKWDRVYVSTLFTYEWDKSKEAIEYAKEIVKDINEIFVGGIMATLNPEFIEQETGIKPIEGRLNCKENATRLGYEDADKIDNITPDYSILNDVSYKYSYSNDYFAFMTRGCGMDCDFCAVKILEPKYETHISIREQIEAINEKYGEKRNLLLMDNNVLKSPQFEEIINEIVEMGFGKGKYNKKYTNPGSGAKVERYVDFNQGLDANYLTEEKARLLSQINIKPARIAFDNIKEENKYRDAVERCARYGINYISNYILYNAPGMKGKGNTQYEADTPVDLYNRIRITNELKNYINRDRKGSKKVKIFSFPMRYVPLDRYDRKYKGPKWNHKYLRAVQVMLHPTQGKGPSKMSYFHAAFGNDEKEYEKYLMMPESILMIRGEPKRLKRESDEEWEKRYNKYIKNQKIVMEWERLYNIVNKKSLLKLIKDNKFSTNKYLKIVDDSLKKIYLHYLSNSQFCLLLYKIQNGSEKELIYNYTMNEHNLFIKKIAKYIYEKQVYNKKLIGYLDVYRLDGLKLLLQEWTKNDFEDESRFLNRLEKANRKFGLINNNFLYVLKILYDNNYFTEKEIKNLKAQLLNLNILTIAYYITSKENDLKEVMTGRNVAKNDIDIILETIETAESYLEENSIKKTLIG
ncbi:MAG: hypothetical protein ACOCRK_01835 [bacterium]